MNLSFITSTTRKVTSKVIEHAPTILTSCNVVGVIATGVVSAKAAILSRDTIIAHEMDEELKVERYESFDGGEIEGPIVYYRERTTFEKAKLTWKIWAVPVATGAITITCGIGANSINASRICKLAAAWSMSDEAAKRFRSKVEETIGEKKTKKIDREIVQDQINSTPIPGIIPVVGYGTQLYFDKWSGQYFYSDHTYLDQMENRMNKLIRKENSASINRWYSLLGLNHTRFGTDFGFIYNGNPKEDDFHIYYDTMYAADGITPCNVVDFDAEMLP